MIRIIQSGLFSRSIKRLHPNEKETLASAVRELIGNPELGDSKIGDLSGVRIYKFKFNADKMLLAYLFDLQTNSLTLLSYGSHENFYRDLKKAL